MKTWALLALASVAGGFSRYILAGAVYHTVGSDFPYGTLAVNALGCLLMGLFEGLAEGHGAIVGPEARTFLMTGFCGAFTTFSALALDANNLSKHHLGRSFSYLLLSLVLGLALLRAGIVLGRLAPR